MERWQSIVKETITTPEALANFIDVDLETIRRVHRQFPLRVNPYYLSLIQKRGDPIWKQLVPSEKELTSTGLEDPLDEEKDSPVKGITHRYPDRVLFYISHICSMYCRFCTRKRKVSNPTSVSSKTIEAGLDYINDHSQIRDVIVSGGDPLMLSDEQLEHILQKLRAIKHVEIIRIGSRVPVTLPQRITDKLCLTIKKYHPIYLNTHFNHPQEITPESRRACGLLANAGIPLGNQSVLLKGVNDDPQVMKKLNQKLLAIRVRPYIMYQADLVRGTDHFRTDVQTGLDILKALRGHTSGLAIPHFVIDAPGGGGKIALINSPLVSFDNKEIVLKNFKDKIYRYPSLSSVPPCEVLP